MQCVFPKRSAPLAAKLYVRRSVHVWSFLRCKNGTEHYESCRRGACACVFFTPDLAFEKHVGLTTVSVSVFFSTASIASGETFARPRECSYSSPRVRDQITATHAPLANAPKTTTDKLQRVLNAAARVITGTRKFDRGLTHILQRQMSQQVFNL